MAETPTVFASGTTTPTVGTETFLSSPNVVGVFEFDIDLANMLSSDGDVLEIRVYKLFKSGGTPRVIFVQGFYGTPITDATGAVTVPFSVLFGETNGARVSITQTKGVAKAFDWAVGQF